MCHQTVGLVQAQLERDGIVTASLSMMPEITRKIRPPRALAVPYPLGFPLGEARAPRLQVQLLTVLLSLCMRSTVPILEGFDPEAAFLDSELPTGRRSESGLASIEGDRGRPPQAERATNGQVDPVLT